MNPTQGEIRTNAVIALALTAEMCFANLVGNICFCWHLCFAGACSFPSVSVGIVSCWHKSKSDLERFMLEKLENGRRKWWFNQTSQMWMIWGILASHLRSVILKTPIIQYIFSLKTSLELFLFELNCLRDMVFLIVFVKWETKAI